MLQPVKIIGRIRSRRRIHEQSRRPLATHDLRREREGRAQTYKSESMPLSKISYVSVCLLVLTKSTSVQRIINLSI